MLAYVDAYETNKSDVKINEEDTYSIPETLAYIMIPLLERYQRSRNKTQIPIAFCEFDPENEILSTTELTFEAERFNRFIEETIWLFGEYKNGREGWLIANEKDRQAYEERRQKALENFGKYFECLHW